MQTVRPARLGVLIMFLGLVTAVLLTVVILITRTKRKNRLPYPPGPPADPLIGHLRHLPKKDAENVFAEWAKIYGDIMHLRIPGRSNIVLSSVEIANDIMDKRGGNYSSRPEYPIWDLMGWSDLLPLLPYGKRFHRQRRIFQDGFNARAIAKYESLQHRSAHQLINLLLKRKDDFSGSILRYTLSILTQITYGRAISSDDDYLFQLMKKNAASVAQSGTPGGTPVDFLPFLKHVPSWFPGTHYVRHARNNRYIADDSIEKPYATLQEFLAKGDNPECFMTQQLSSFDPKGPDAGAELLFIKQSCAGALSAGNETTWGSLLVFVLAMVLYPECQKIAQEEIDSITGSNRLPALSDRGNLPYVQALCHEISRWHPVTPLAIPHMSLKDDIYNDMLIPGGSVVIANLHAMSRDTRVYSDPDTFDPMRYIPRPQGKGEPPFTAAFGFGRRVCPGRQLAEINLWIAIATMLATINFSAPVDANGVKHPPIPEFESALTSHPKPFKCKVEARNEKATTLIDQTLSWDA